jgi:hypothetical protein
VVKERLAFFASLSFPCHNLHNEVADSRFTSFGHEFQVCRQFWQNALRKSTQVLWLQGVTIFGLNLENYPKLAVGRELRTVSRPSVVVAEGRRDQF